jgi:hypothetical protein
MARKTALTKVLGVLDEQEAADVTDIDLDDVMLRFHNLHGKGFTPESLQTYKSRVKSGLDDFRAYLENPLGFRPGGSRREPRSKPAGQEKGAQRKGGVVAQNSEVVDQLAVNKPIAAPTFEEAAILPIPLRADLTIRIQGLPFDLTSSEAKKIANVVLAMVGE